ncbi:uncharacterized protein LOC141651438 [Silene latifolia]|uniref:uncharacterized protein LOC141651438 n=1 Tax=Silene latifolia TaxID=37657 RepID=UPI003D76A53B
MVLPDPENLPVVDHLAEYDPGSGGHRPGPQSYLIDPTILLDMPEPISTSEKQAIVPPPREHHRGRVAREAETETKPSFSAPSFYLSQYSPHPIVHDPSMQVFNFPSHFQNWIMSCITSPWYSVKINGAISGFFKGASGLRHGDPLSPFIFVMSMKMLSRILRGIHSQAQVTYHPKCGKIGLNHLIFADDLIVFVRGDTPSVQAVTDSLTIFAQMSGLKANPEKTNIYMGGIREEIKQAILRTTGYAEGTFLFRYLGVPLNEGKLNKIMFADLLHKIQSALTHWATHRLSYAGKEIGNEELGFLLCSSQGGGFNINEVLAWNKSVLCKWLWAIEHHSDSTWSQWNRVYNIKSENFWTMQIKSYHSESWRSILQVRNELINRSGGISQAQENLSSCVKNGKFHLHLVYDQLRNKENSVVWTKGVWHRAVLPKHSFFMVLAMQRCLATVDKLNHKGICIINRCILCKATCETHRHLFFRCPYSAALWT